MPPRSLWAFFSKNRILLVVILLGIFLFYWYELRPIRLYRSCSTSASADARALLQSKADIAGNTPQGASYRNLIDRNMYLRSDYESFLKKCLLYYGLTPPDTEAPEDAADTPTNES